MLAGDDYTQLVTGRMFDFVNRHAPWHLALWSIGTVLALEETSEYADHHRSGALTNDKGLRYVVESTRTLVAADAGVGSEELRDAILVTLDPKKLDSAAVGATLRHLTDRLRDDYLDRLASAARDAQPPGVEALASSATAHLLDMGFSSGFVHHWLGAQAKDDAATYDIGDLLERAAAVCRAAPDQYDVMIPFDAMPQGFAGGMPAEWLDSQQTAATLATFDPPLTDVDVRQAGSVMISIEARDPWSAAEAAAEVVAQAAARVAVSGSHSRLRPKGVAWLRGQSREFPLRSRTRVHLRSLKTADQVFRLSADPGEAAVFDALEVFALLDSGTRGAELTGGWAAVEGLLLRAGESPHTIAADRLAAITACAFPRAELTALSYRHSPPAPDALSNALDGVEVNVQRCRILEDAIRNGHQVLVARPSDRAMLRRVEGMIADPATKLRNVERYVSETFRRLYTQRNLIMHASSFRSVTLRATLRTAPRLVAAGVDRIVDAYTAAPRVEPVALAARAEAELGLLGTPASRRLCELLD